ncbi:Methyltransferase domain-containing protein [Streptomyces sp. 1222.5]|uniref:class I SAM-dependent methyltransferase n=1 Tax=unclassified Streptomyces TaxID=2593676 RepID=UPI0008949DC0|nr:MULTISPECIES: class I SAM-dependent methyltransferase [unclassified Streptomyces]PKW05505.1 methyltransferase family protein [Streptomyces sp. 5112.2]SEC18640.1 Methyltransferase domain-containing protein [Streptomyces sp. 2231.1]SED37369.1 Methyltransferase domain-containing protein [Streptomyces sp. 1222.5]
MEGGHYGEDLFPPDRAGEAERIDYGALAYDTVSRARLAALGVGPGWRCLDVGAGTGTISRWLAEEAGADEVLALDRDPRFVRPAQDSGLRTMAGDITDPALDPGRFDLVHCRFVLMHLPQHAEVLARLAGWVAPGGWLVVGDALDLTTADSPHTAYRRAMEAMWQVLRDTIGTDITWMTDYPHILSRLGLADVGAEVVLPPLTVDAPITAFWKNTWLSMRDALESGSALTAGELDDALDYLSSPSLADLSPGMITAWGRRPGP